jgi:thiol-disulfide isomerase/thioredoxin
LHFPRQVVAATLDELVLQSHRDVLLLVHAPWCTSCAPLHSELHKLANRYADTAERLMIATYDAGLNDVPRTLPVDRMPTLLFFTGEPNHADGAGGSAAGGAAGSAAEGGGEVASVDAVTRVPIDLSEFCTAHELSDALVRHAKAPLRAPTDVRAHRRLATSTTTTVPPPHPHHPTPPPPGAQVAQLQQALAMLPRFQREAQTLLEENERLRTELAEARRQVALAAPTGEPAP